MGVFRSMANITQVNPMVLPAINAIRKNLGLEPLECIPKGERQDPCRCPIANSIPYDCKVNRLYIMISPREGQSAYDIYVTSVLRDFIWKFDQGVHEDLDIDNDEGGV